MIARVPAERWQAAFERIRFVERASNVLDRAWRSRRFDLRGSTAISRKIKVEELPHYLKPKPGVVGVVRARIRAELVVIGKFDVDEEVRFRAFYPDRGLTIRFQGGRVRKGIDRSLLAHSFLREFAPSFGPRILDNGTVDDAAYLVEEVVEGASPRGPAQIEERLGDITRGLSALHQGAGIEHQRLDDVLGERFLSRWDEAVESGVIDGAIDDACRELLAREGTVPVSIGHGDLVESNILIRDSGVTLIDWEYARFMPVLFDVAKLHLHCSNADRGAELLMEGLRTSLKDGTTHYSVREQIALAHMRYLAWGAVRMQRARAANRQSQLEAVSQLRQESVRTLLGLE